ncbi:MAG: AsmA family protein [Kiritimatiellaeota bacterium]|nr:AsmA family protein [Kiritimatiellota bacterium]
MKSRVLKIAAVALGVVVLLVAGLIVFINPIVKNTVNVGGPLMLGVPVKIETVSISPIRGKFELKKFSVGNPENYATDKALFAVDSIHVDMDMKSLFGNVLHIRKIQIDAPQISYEVKGGKSNFDVLMENLGENEKKKKDKKEKDAAEKKVIIDEFQLNGARVSLTHPIWTVGKTLPLPIPSITRRDIGKDKGGASPVEVMMTILTELGNVIVNAGKVIGDGVKDAAKAVGDGAKDAVKAVGEGAKDAVKAVGEGAKDAAKSLKNIFK